MQLDTEISAAREQSGAGAMLFQETDHLLKVARS
jgi:hypothetical protein